MSCLSCRSIVPPRTSCGAVSNHVPRCHCSVSALHHSHYQFLQKGPVMPKACSPFPTEVSPLQGCFKTFRVRLFILDWKRKKTQSGLVSLVPWKSGTTQSYPMTAQMRWFSGASRCCCQCQCHGVLLQWLSALAWRGHC